MADKRRKKQIVHVAKGKETVLATFQLVVKADGTLIIQLVEKDSG